MKRAESTGGPPKGRSNALLSTARKPLLLLLGSCMSFDFVEAPTVDAPPTIAPQETEGETPEPVVPVPQDEPEQEADDAGEAGEAGEMTADGPAPGFEPDAERAAEPSLVDEVPMREEPAGKLSGYVNLRSRSRFAEDADQDDHDLYGVVGLDYATPGAKSWGIHILARGSWGLDEQDPDSIFYSTQDTYTGQVDARLYRAYVDAPVSNGLGLARIGRMAIYDTPVTAYFDGVQFESEPSGRIQLVAGLYGGLSVHQFEGWPSDEWMGGMYTRFRPWVDGSLRFDWMRLTDDERFGDGDNDLLSAKLAHRICDDARVEGSFSAIDGKSNDMRVKGFWVLPEQDMTVRVSYYSLLREQENLNFELNPYFNILSTYFPYDQSQIVISKVFGETLDLFGGFDMRRVDDEGDIGRYNRDFDRYYLTAALADLVSQGTTLSVTGEVWDSPDNDVSTWGLDLTTRLQEEMKLSLGSYYSLYKYKFDVNSEREDVRTFYMEVRNTVSEATNLTVRYEYEDEEIDSFHSLWLGVTWRF